MKRISKALRRFWEVCDQSILYSGAMLTLSEKQEIDDTLSTYDLIWCNAGVGERGSWYRTYEDISGLYFYTPLIDAQQDRNEFA